MYIGEEGLEAEVLNFEGLEAGCRTILTWSEKAVLTTTRKINDSEPKSLFDCEVCLNVH